MQVLNPIKSKLVKFTIEKPPKNSKFLSKFFVEKW